MSVSPVMMQSVSLVMAVPALQLPEAAAQYPVRVQVLAPPSGENVTLPRAQMWVPSSAAMPAPSERYSFTPVSTGGA